MTDDAAASTPLLGPSSIARRPPLTTRALRGLRALVSAPTRVSTCARATVLLSAVLLLTSGLLVIPARSGAFLAPLALSVAEDVLCGRGDPALPAARAPAEISACLASWVHRLGQDPDLLDAARPAASAKMAVRASAAPDDLGALLPWMRLGLLNGAGLGAGLATLGAALVAALCMRRGRARACFKVPLCACSCALAAVLAGVAMMAFTTALVLGSQAAWEVFAAGGPGAAGGYIVADGEELPGGEFMEVEIDSLDLLRSVEVDAVAGVTFPHLDTIADPAAKAFRIAPYFLAKNVYYGVSDILEMHSHTGFVQDFEATLENFARIAGSFNSSALPKDRTALPRMFGRMLSLPTVLVAPSNASLLCALQDSLACRGFATGDCAKTGSECLETAAYVCFRESAAAARGPSFFLVMPAY